MFYGYAAGCHKAIQKTASEHWLNMLGRAGALGSLCVSGHLLGGLLRSRFLCCSLLRRFLLCFLLLLHPAVSMLARVCCRHVITVHSELAVALPYLLVRTNTNTYTKST